MRKRDKGPSAAWPRWIRLQKEKDGGAVEAAIAEQKALELKYPLTRAGKRKTTEQENYARARSDWFFGQSSRGSYRSQTERS